MIHEHYPARSEEPSNYNNNGTGKKTPSLGRSVSLSLSARASNAVAGLNNRRRAAASAPSAIGLDAEQIEEETTSQIDEATTASSQLAGNLSRQDTVKVEEKFVPSTMALANLAVRYPVHGPSSTSCNWTQDEKDSKIKKDLPTVRMAPADDRHTAQAAPVSRKGRIRTSSRAAARASELFRSFVQKQFPAAGANTNAAGNGTQEQQQSRQQQRVEVVAAAVLGAGTNPDSAKTSVSQGQGSSHVRARSAAALSRTPAPASNDANFTAGTDALAATAARHDNGHSHAKSDGLLLHLDRGDARAAAPSSHATPSESSQPRRSSVSSQRARSRRFSSDGKEQEVIDLRFIPSAGSWYALLGLTYEMKKIPRQQQAVPPPTGVKLPEVPDATTPRMKTDAKLTVQAMRYADEYDEDAESLSDSSPMTPKPVGAPPSSHLTLPSRWDVMGRTMSVDSNASQDTIFFSVPPSSAGSSTPPPRVPKSHLRLLSASLSTGKQSFPDSPLLYAYADGDDGSQPATAERRRSSLTPTHALALATIARRQSHAVYAAAAVSPTRSTFSQAGSVRNSYGAGHEVLVVRTHKRPVSLDGAPSDRKESISTSIEWTCIARRQRSNTGTCVCGRDLRAIQYVTRGGVRVATFPVCSRCAAARETIRRGGCAKTLPMDPNATQVPVVALGPTTGSAWIVPALAPSTAVMPLQPTSQLLPSQQPPAVATFDNAPSSLSVLHRASSFVNAVQAARSAPEQISGRQMKNFEQQRFSSATKPSLSRTDSATDPMLAPASPLTEAIQRIAKMPQEAPLRPSASRTYSEFGTARQGPPPLLLRHNSSTQSSNSLRHDYQRRADSVERGGTRSAALSPVVQAWQGSTSPRFDTPFVFENKNRERTVSFASFDSYASETSSASASTNESRSTVASPRATRFSDLPSSPDTHCEAAADDDDTDSTRTDATTVTNSSRASTAAVDLPSHDEKSISAQIRLDSRYYRTSNISI